MKGSGTLPTLIVFVVIVVTSLFIFLVSGVVLSVWGTSCEFVSYITNPLNQKVCTKSPVQIEVIIKPEYIPLTVDHALRSLLESTDSQSGRQVQELLAYAVLNQKSSFSLDGKNIDLEKIIDEKMNSLMPKREYNLVVKKGLLNFGNPELAGLLTTTKTETGTFSKYRSSTTLTTPDLKKVQVVLFIR